MCKGSHRPLELALYVADQRWAGHPIYLAPQSIEIVETVVLLNDDDDVVESVHRRGVVRLRDRRRSDDGGKSEYSFSNVHDEPPRI